MIAINLAHADIDHVDLHLDDGGGWEIVFASDWSGYHSTGSDLAVLCNGGCTLAGYGVVVAVPSSRLLV